MAIETKRSPPRECPRCGGSMLIEDGAWRCQSCAKELPLGSTRHQWIEDHREWITDLYYKGGTKLVLKETGMSSSTWVYVRRRWGLILAPHRSPRQPASDNGHLPSYPEFSNDWTPEVQLKWLDVYRALHQDKKGEEGA